MSRNVPTQTLLTPYVRLKTSRHFGNIKSLLTDICGEVGLPLITSGGDVRRIVLAPVACELCH
jgi:hypothetical protein